MKYYGFLLMAAFSAGQLADDKQLKGSSPTPDPTLYFQNKSGTRENFLKENEIPKCDSWVGFTKHEVVRRYMFKWKGSYVQVTYYGFSNRHDPSLVEYLWDVYNDAVVDMELKLLKLTFSPA